MSQGLPQAIYCIEAASFSSVYGTSEQEDLNRLVEVIAHPSTEKMSAPPAVDWREVEFIYSGWGVPVMDAKFLDQFPALKVVFHAAGSVKSFVTPEIWERGIRVTCAAQLNAVPVAEYTLSQILFCLKHGWQRVREISVAGIFRKMDEAMPGAFESTVGLISLSRTGQLVAQHLRNFDLKVIAYDPFISTEEAATLGVALCSLDELFARSDVVSCHTPLLESTQHLLRGRHFSLMKNGATFINTARGKIVHEPEMLAVFSERPEIFAVLDVTDPEPPELGSLIMQLPNIVVTPHIAGSLGPECRRLGRMMVAETQRWLSDGTLRGEVFANQMARLA